MVMLSSRHRMEMLAFLNHDISGDFLALQLHLRALSTPALWRPADVPAPHVQTRMERNRLVIQKRMRRLTEALSPIRNWVSVIRDPNATALDKQRAASELNDKAPMLEKKLHQDVHSLKSVSRSLKLLLDEGGLNERQRTAAHNLYVAVSQLHETLHDALTPETQTYDLQKVVKKFQEYFQGHPTTVAVHGLEDPVLIQGRPALMLRVLKNLHKNAHEAGAQSVQLHVEQREYGNGEKPHLVLRVQDDGAGIPNDQVPHVFQFGHSTKDTGTGLGLAFAQHVVRQHNGIISVQNNPHQRGVTFTLAIPLAEREAFVKRGTAA